MYADVENTENTENIVDHTVYLMQEILLHHICLFFLNMIICRI